MYIYIVYEKVLLKHSISRWRQIITWLGLTEDQIIVEKAPEPEEILWENLSTSYSEILIRIAFTIVLCFLVCSACFLVLYIIFSYQQDSRVIFYNIFIGISK